MSWGNKLVLVFIAFTTLIGTLVYKAVHTDFDLVTPEYYQEELKYEDHIDAMQNAARLSEVTIRQDAVNVVVTLPKEMEGYKVDGKAWFYYNASAEKDRQISFSTLNGTASFSKEDLAKGNVLLKLSWNSGTENYYVEKMISL